MAGLRSHPTSPSSTSRMPVFRSFGCRFDTSGRLAGSMWDARRPGEKTALQRGHAAGPANGSSAGSLSLAQRRDTLWPGRSRASRSANGGPTTRRRLTRPVQGDDARRAEPGPTLASETCRSAAVDAGLIGDAAMAKPCVTGEIGGAIRVGGSRPCQRRRVQRASRRHWRWRFASNVSSGRSR